MRQYFIKPSERTFCFLFPVVWPGMSCRERGTAKPKCRCSTWQDLLGVSWPDKAGREIQPFIYIPCGFACCVLNFQTPLGFCRRWRQRDSFPLTGWNGLSRKMSDSYVLINCEVLTCGQSVAPCWFFLLAAAPSFRTGYGWRQLTSCRDLIFSTMDHNDSSSRESMKFEHTQNCQLGLFSAGDDLITVSQFMETIKHPWIACMRSELSDYFWALVHLTFLALL